MNESISRLIVKLIVSVLLGGAVVLAGCSAEPGGENASSGESSGQTAPSEKTSETSAEASAGSKQAEHKQKGAERGAVAPEKAHQAHQGDAEKEKAGARSGKTGAESGAKSRGSGAARDGRLTALAGMEKADRLATRWNQDARLYAIASVVPEVDSSGRSPGWLYTYVSPSAGAVAGIAVEGGEAERKQEQSLPNADLERIMTHTLPPQSKLKDSTEAMKEAGEVQRYLEENPDAQASAGLDSFSSEKPSWILATISRDQRLEEKVPATSGS